MSNSKKPRDTWDAMPDYLKAIYSCKEDWERTRDAVIAREQEERRRPRRPPDWVEPAIRIEEVDEFFEPDLVPYMRARGMTRITRSEYFEFKYPDGVPLEWNRDYELELPDGLQDLYMTIDKRLKRN